METTEDQLPEQAPHQEHSMVLTQEAQYYLQQAGKWAKFLGIMGFIGCGFLLLAAVFAGSLIGLMTKFSPTPNPALAIMGPTLGIVYFLMAVLFFFVNYNLFLFGSRVQQGVAYINNEMVTGALGKLKSFFKIKGIILIVVLSIYLLIIVCVIIAGVGAATMMQH